MIKIWVNYRKSANGSLIWNDQSYYKRNYLIFFYPYIRNKEHMPKCLTARNFVLLLRKNPGRG